MFFVLQASGFCNPIFFFNSFLVGLYAANKVVQYQVLGICVLHPMFLNIFFAIFIAY